MAELSKEDRDYLLSKGLDPDTFVESGSEKMSGGHAALATLKARAGSILGGGGGTLAGAATGAELGAFGGPAAPVTVPIGGLVGAVVGGLSGSYAGEKAQQAVVPKGVEEQLQAEAAQALQEHPWISRGTEIGASALASGGKPSPGALLRGGRAVLAGDFTAPVVRNLATQAAVNPAIDIGTSLATGNGLPSGKDILGDVAGGLLFSEPSSLGRLAHRSSSEPSPEPTTQPDITPPVGTESLLPLKMAPPATLPVDESTGAAAKNKDLVTQNKMDQTSVTPNKVDTKVTSTEPVKPPIVPLPEATPAPTTPPIELDPFELAKKIADPNGGRLTAEENAWLKNLSEKEPDTHQAFMGYIKDLKNPPTTKVQSQRQGFEPQTYNDEDLQTYNELNKRMVDEADQVGSPEYTKLWQDFENVRNKYGGMPPKQVWDAAQAAQVKSPLLTESRIRNPIALAQHIMSGQATTGSVLDHLANSPNHPMADLARHLFSTSDKESLRVPWKVAAQGQSQRSAYEYGPGMNHVVMGMGGLGDSRVTMEEAIHSMTSRKLDVFNNLRGLELKTRMDDYLREGNNPAVKDIIRAYTKVAEHFGFSDILFKNKFDVLGTKNRMIPGAAGDADLVQSIGEKMGHGDVMYAMGNLDEFIAHSFKNEHFQHLLDEIPSGEGGKTVWRKLIDSIKRLLGVDVKQGSMLEHVLSRSNELIGQARPKESPGDFSILHPDRDAGETEYKVLDKKGKEVWKGEDYELAHLFINDHSRHFSAKAQKSPDEEHHMGPIGRFTRAVIDRVHDIPRQDAKDLANATKLSLNEEDHLRGRWKNSIIEVGKKLNPHDLEMINRVRDLENTTGTLSRQTLDSDAQRTYYDTMKRNMSESGDYAIKANMPVASDKGPRPLRKEPSHWPSMANDTVRNTYQSGDLAAIAKLDKEFDNWNQTKVGLTPAGSKTVIDRYKEAIQGSVKNSDISHQDQFKAFRRAMGTPIPPSFREQNPVRNDSRYFDRAATALSHYKFIESNHKVMATLGATHDAWGKPITPNPNGSLANNQDVKNLLHQFKGTPRGLGENAEQSASSLMSNFLISGPTLETHKLISNAVGAVNLSDNPYQLSRALAHGLTNVKEGYRHAVENGLAKLTASSSLDMFNGSLSAAQRMNGMGKALRDVSTLGDLTTKANLGFLQSYFEYLVPSKIQRANAGNVDNQRFVRRLDPTYAQGKTYTTEETQKLASVAASYLHGTGDIRTLPAWMMNDSELSGFFKLAHWSVAQTNNFMSNVWTPARNGNLTPLLTSIFGATIGGYMIKQLREEMQGKKSGIPSLSEIAGSDRELAGNAGPLVYNAIAAMQYSGFGGLLSQVAKYPFDFVYKNIPQGATFPLDQIATDLTKTVGQVTSAIANDPNVNWVDLAKAVTGHVLQNDMQLSRIAINQGINAGLITGLPAEKKNLSDRMGQLRRFDMVEGLPYNDIEQTSNPFMNIEQQKFKHEPDVQQAVRMIPELVTNIMDRYRSQPDVMMSKLKALKENQYDTMPSLESMPLQFFHYMQYVERTKGPEAAQDMMRDYMTHKMVNQVKSSVAP